MTGYAMNLTLQSFTYFYYNRLDLVQSHMAAFRPFLPFIHIVPNGK